MYALENLKPNNFSFFNDLTEVFKDLLNKLYARPNVMETKEKVEAFIKAGPWFEQIRKIIFKHTNITVELGFDYSVRWVAMLNNVDPKTGVDLEEYDKNFTNKEFLKKDQASTVNYFIKTCADVAGAFDQYSSQVDLKALPHYFSKGEGPLMFLVFDPVMFTKEGLKETPLTAAEIAATILHEIGHFYGMYIIMLFGTEAGITANGFSNYVETDPTLKSTITLVEDCLKIATSIPDKGKQTTQLVYELNKSLNDLHKDGHTYTREKLMAIQWYATTLTGNISGAYIINTLMIYCSHTQRNFYPHEISLKRMVGIQERFADRYAAQMGAGKDLAKTFEKFYFYGQNIPQDQIETLYTGSLIVYWLINIGWYCNPLIWMLKLFDIAAFPGFSPHEKETQRIEDILKSLYSQFAKENIDPQVKKIYAQQIEFIRTTLEKIKKSDVYRLDEALSQGLRAVFTKGPIGAMMKSADFRARLNARLHTSHEALDNPGYYHGYLLDQIIAQTEKGGTPQ